MTVPTWVWAATIALILAMLVYDFGWQLRDLGRASATAWLLFLVTRM